MNPACGIYIINLARSPDRLAMQREQFQKLALSFARVEAVDGSALEFPHPALDERGFHRRHGKTINPNELGCTLSHIRAIQMFADSENEFAVILEDDADLSDHFEQVIDAAIAQSDRWDMVKLNRRHSGMPVSVASLTADHRLIAYLAKQSGAVGYLINRKAARAYIDGLLPMRVPYDHEFDRGHAYGLRVFGVLPPVVKDNLTTGSTIGYGYDSDLPGEKPLTKPRKLPRIKRLTAYAYRSSEAVIRFFSAGWNALVAKTS